MKIQGKQVFIVDIEANGFLDIVSKIHCLGMAYEQVDNRWEVKSTVEYKSMKDLLQKDCIIVGHNFVSYDIPVIQKIYPDIEIKATIWDSLFFSYGLFDKRPKHGLESWGEDFGIPKPKVDDWENQPVEVYLNRVEEDCKINTGMFLRFWSLINVLYDNDIEMVLKHVDYLNFLAKKAKAQEHNIGFSVDIEAATELVEKLEKEKAISIEKIAENMPKNPKKDKKTKPKKCYKNDGTISSLGQKWFDFLDAVDLPRTHEDPVEYIRSYEDPKPTSPKQVKDWLFGLGWKPLNFETRESKVTGVKTTTPQVRIEVDGVKELCPSVMKLAEKEPGIEWLDKLGLLTHRIGLLKGKSGLLIANKGDNHQIKQRVGALANTYRYKHSVLVNIPKQKLYGKEIRKCLIAPKGYKIVSGDVKALEDTTKLISLKPIDPDYVEKFSDPSYDAHLDISQKANILDSEEADTYSSLKKKDKREDLSKEESDIYFELTTRRGLGKRANFACTYGAFPKKIAATIDKPLKVAKKLFDAYWEINGAIKIFAESLTVKKTEDGRMWLKSNISGFWLSLRAEKDRFSLHNQNMGRYLFDTYTGYVFALTGYLPNYDQHDDATYIIPEDKVKWFVENQYKAMSLVNKKYNLVIPLQIEPAVGDNLAEV